MPLISPGNALTGLLEKTAKVVAYATAVITAVGYLLTSLQWGRRGPFALAYQYRTSFWMLALTTSILVLLVWTYRLQTHFVSGFADDFKGDPRRNWDFVGAWRVINDKELVVTGSDAGGITKRELFGRTIPSLLRQR